MLRRLVELPPILPAQADGEATRQQPGLFEAQRAPEAWIDDLLASETYSAQRGMAGRGVTTQ